MNMSQLHIEILSQRCANCVAATDWSQTILIVASILFVGLCLHNDLMECRREMRYELWLTQAEIRNTARGSGFARPNNGESY